MNDGRPAITNRIVNRIDRQRPDAPELAAHGPHAIGVRTLELVHPDQIDVAAIDAAGGTDTPLHDRRLTVEIWYPAQAEASGSTEIETFLRDGRTTSDGDAAFDASLRAQDPTIGYKDAAVVLGWMAGAGLEPRDPVTMPANNLFLLADRRG